MYNVTSSMRVEQHSQALRCCATVGNNHAARIVSLRFKKPHVEVPAAYGHFRISIVDANFTLRLEWKQPKLYVCNAASLRIRTAYAVAYNAARGISSHACAPHGVIQHSQHFRTQLWEIHALLSVIHRNSIDVIVYPPVSIAVRYHRILMSVTNLRCVVNVDCACCRTAGVVVYSVVVYICIHLRAVLEVHSSCMQPSMALYLYCMMQALWTKFALSVVHDHGVQKPSVAAHQEPS